MNSGPFFRTLLTHQGSQLNLSYWDIFLSLPLFLYLYLYLYQRLGHKKYLGNNQ